MNNIIPLRKAIHAPEGTQKSIKPYNKPYNNNHLTAEEKEQIDTIKTIIFTLLQAGFILFVVIGYIMMCVFSLMSLLKL